MICNKNYPADIPRVCETKDLICVMRFQSLLYVNLNLQHEKNILGRIELYFGGIEDKLNLF